MMAAIKGDLVGSKMCTTTSGDTTPIVSEEVTWGAQWGAATCPSKEKLVKAEGHRNHLS